MEDNIWFEFERKAAIEISDVQKICGAVPETFQKCVSCSRQARYILCAITQEENYIARDWDETSAQAFAEEVRSQFGTNIEIPVCEFHIAGAAAN